MSNLYTRTATTRFHTRLDGADLDATFEIFLKGVLSNGDTFLRARTVITIDESTMSREEWRRKMNAKVKTKFGREPRQSDGIPSSSGMGQLADAWNLPDTLKIARNENTVALAYTLTSTMTSKAHKTRLDEWIAASSQLETAEDRLAALTLFAGDDAEHGYQSVKKAINKAIKEAKEAEAGDESGDESEPVVDVASIDGFLAVVAGVTARANSGFYTAAEAAEAIRALAPALAAFESIVAVTVAA